MVIKKYQSKQCKECYIPSTKIIWPPTIELLELKVKAYIVLAEELGVSDNGIRRRLRKEGIVPPRAKDVKNIDLVIVSLAV